MTKLGAPITYPYTDELAQEICDGIRSSSLGLKQLCKKHPHWPPKSVIMRWRAQNTLFADLYLRAKADQVETFVDEIVSISDDGINDTYIDENGNERTNHDVIARSRLRVDSRKWIAAKLAPKIYGDRSPLADSKEGDDFISKHRDKLNEQG